MSPDAEYTQKETVAEKQRLAEIEAKVSVSFVFLHSIPKWLFVIYS
jgi:hypothetical protein